MADENQNDVTSLTVQLLSAFVSNNMVPSEDLASLIKTTRAALLEEVMPVEIREQGEFTPAVSIRKSLSSRDHILSLIDGKPYKTLKRHLAQHGLTEKSYRKRYGLPATYPMVAPSYSEARRAVAQKLGLGKKAATGTKVRIVALNRAASSETVEMKAASALKPSRKKLSIAASGAKGGAFTSATKPVQQSRQNANDSVSGVSAAAKPKSLEAAIKAAADHLSAGSTNQ
jgi:predicted transcriptional regulator